MQAGGNRPFVDTAALSAAQAVMHFPLAFLFFSDTNAHIKNKGNAMKKLLLTLPIITLAACTSLPSMVGDMSYTKIDDVNYEVTVVGKKGVSKEKLRSALDEKLKTLCGMPYLPRHNKEEITSTVDGKPNSYTITLGAQCFTKQDMLDYEKSVSDAKKGKGKGSKPKAKKKQK